MKTKVMLILLSLAMIACAPMSKDAYMEQYAEFMYEIGENASSYTESDWIENDGMFNKYSEVYYQKFQKELTSSDKMTLAKYKVEYTYYKCKGKSKAKAGDIMEKLAGCAASLGNDLSNTLNEIADEVMQNEYLDNLSDKVSDIIDQLESDNL